jgi:ribose transport system substrate-binding protein
MKKILGAMLVLVFLFSVTGCGTQTAATEPALVASETALVTTEAPTPEVTKAATKQGSMKIGMLVPTLQYDFFVTLTDGLKAAFAAEGYELTVASYDLDANKAISIIENFTIEGVDAIIAMVADKSADGALQAAMDKGIYVIEAGVLTDAYTIGMVADNKDAGTKIGEMAADYINTKLGGIAEVVAFVNQSSSDMADRSAAMVEALKKNAPKATIVGTATIAATGEGTTAMENFLQQYPNIKVVISYGDSGALEAIEVVKAANKTEGFGAFGCDATKQALQIISEGGPMKGTIDMGNLVNLMAEPTIRLLKGDTTVPKINYGVNTKVTAENVADFLK